jgi:hypothetical protein
MSLRLSNLEFAEAQLQVAEFLNAIPARMDKAKILQAAPSELQRHTWGTFVGEGLTIALGGQGIVTLGCEACRKRINTNGQYLRHLADDVLPGILEYALKPDDAR